MGDAENDPQSCWLRVTFSEPLVKVTLMNLSARIQWASYGRAIISPNWKPNQGSWVQAPVFYPLSYHFTADDGTMYLQVITIFQFTVGGAGIGSQHRGGVSVSGGSRVAAVFICEEVALHGDNSVWCTSRWVDPSNVRCYPRSRLKYQIWNRFIFCIRLHVRGGGVPSTYTRIPHWQRRPSLLNVRMQSQRGRRERKCFTRSRELNHKLMVQGLVWLPLDYRSTTRRLDH